MDGLTASADTKTKVFDVLDERGTPYSWLARQMGVSQNYIYQIRSGRKPITERFIEDSVRIFGMPRESLFFGVSIHTRMDESTGDAA